MVQDQSGNLASADQTDGYVSDVLATEIGYRIGSVHQSREGNFGGLYSFFPNAFIVRRADMKIVGHQQVNSYYIMFSEIASLCEGVEIGCEE